jgi:DNA-binding MarR family transcriptional regulator
VRRPPGAEHVDDAAAAILEIVPLAMRAIRGRMRDGRPAGMSVPQFRALLYVRRHPGSGLSEIADHLGTSVPAASELMSRLVRQDLVDRATDPHERRRVRLTLSQAGADELQRAQDQTIAWLRGLVAGLDAPRARALVAALVDLRGIVEGTAAREGA